MTTLFAKRHYNWLAAWAAANLTPPQCERLSRELVGTNPAYQRQKFMDYVERKRAPDVARVGSTAHLLAIKAANIRARNITA